MIVTEIRWHGRGGDGAFTAAKILGHAASIYENRYGQAFPSFGPERRGAPVLGFTKISEQVITDHSQVYQCDCVVVLDETLCEAVDTTMGMKEDSVYVINTKRTAEQVRIDLGLPGQTKVIPIDAYEIALKNLGVPIVNTVLLGAAVSAMGMVDIDSVENAITDMFSAQLSSKNKQAVRAAHDLVREV